MPWIDPLSRRAWMQRMLAAGWGAGGASTGWAGVNRAAIERLSDERLQDLNRALKLNQANGSASAGKMTLRRFGFQWERRTSPAGLVSPPNPDRQLLLPTLSHFSASFGNGDHSIHSLGAWPDTGSGARLQFSDDNGGDMVRGQATWIGFQPTQAIRERMGPGGLERVSDMLSTELRGEAYQGKVTLALTPPPGASSGGARVKGGATEPSWVPVLGGFLLGHRGDKYVKRVVLKILPNNQQVHLSMSDSLDVHQEPVQYRLLIQWLPASLFESLNETVGGTAREGAPFVNHSQRQRTALTGFDLQFTNGGHKLRDIALNNQQSGRRVDWLRWNDSNFDDPIEWQATYRVFAAGLIPDEDLLT